MKLKDKFLEILKEEAENKKKLQEDKERLLNIKKDLEETTTSLIEFKNSITEASQQLSELEKSIKHVEETLKSLKAENFKTEKELNELSDFRNKKSFNSFDEFSQRLNIDERLNDVTKKKRALEVELKFSLREQEELKIKKEELKLKLDELKNSQKEFEKKQCELAEEQTEIEDELNNEDYDSDYDEDYDYDEDCDNDDEDYNYCSGFEDTLHAKKLKRMKNLDLSEKLSENILSNVFDNIEKLSNAQIIKKIQNNELSFREVVDAYSFEEEPENGWCSYYSLHRLLSNEKLFKELIDNNLLLNEDITYLLHSLDECAELNALINDNSFLLSYLYENFLITHDEILKFNQILNQDEEDKFGEYCWSNDWHDAEIGDFFELVEYLTTHELDDLSYYELDETDIDHELLKANELYRKILILNTFNFDQKQNAELFEVLRDNEIARSRFIPLIEDQLESNFDFKSLMFYLKKTDKKRTLNI